MRRKRKGRTKLPPRLVTTATNKLYDVERAVPHLKTLDAYIQARGKNEHLVLSESMQWLQPLGDYLAENPGRYMGWLKALADGRRHADAIDVAEMIAFRRTTYQRFHMARRRRRLQLAQAMFESLHKRKLRGEELDVALRKLERKWMEQRDEFLAAKAAGGTLPFDVKNELIDEFWSEIEAKLEKKTKG